MLEKSCEEEIACAILCPLFWRLRGSSCTCPVPHGIDLPDGWYVKRLTTRTCIPQEDMATPGSKQSCPNQAIPSPSESSSLLRAYCLHAGRVQCPLFCLNMTSWNSLKVDDLVRPGYQLGRTLMPYFMAHLTSA